MTAVMARTKGKDDHESKDDESKDDGDNGEDDSNDGRNGDSSGKGGAKIGGIRINLFWSKLQFILFGMAGHAQSN
jgi:hypothetical protein